MKHELNTGGLLLSRLVGAIGQPKFSIVLVLTCVPAAAGWGQAQTPCNWGPAYYQGDDMVSALWDCPAQFRSYSHDFNLDMGSGFGPDSLGYDQGRAEPCNFDLPLGRVLNGFYMLTHSGTYGQMLNGFQYVLQNLPDSWEASCENWGSGARTIKTSFLWWGSNTIQFAPSFSYFMTPSMRAAAIYHETRHVAGIIHDAQSDCGYHVSCDSSWGFNGANRTEVEWLADYVVGGTVGRGTVLQNSAIGRVTDILKNGFRDTPDLKLDPIAGLVRQCYPNCPPPRPDCVQCKPGGEDCCSPEACDVHGNCRAPDLCPRREQCDSQPVGQPLIGTTVEP